MGSLQNMGKRSPCPSLAFTKCLIVDQTKKTIAVVGAGWAGLAAAVHLAKNGAKVVLFEQSPLLGGRARAANFTPKGALVADETINVDNGQHLLMGAYSETLGLIKELGGNVSDPKRKDQLFDRFPVCLRDTKGFSFDAAIGFGKWLPGHRLGATLRLGCALFRSNGLSFTEAFMMSSMMIRLRIRRWHVNQALSVQALLEGYRQPQSLNRKLWHPLCLSALNTPPANASAATFVAVLRDTLGAAGADSDFLVAIKSLSTTLPDLASAFLTKHNATINTGEMIKSISPKSNTGLAQSAKVWVVSSNKQDLEVDAVVLACPWPTTTRLLASANIAAPASDSYMPLPISTVYLYWSIGANHARAKPWLLVDDADLKQYGQWLFDLGKTAGGGRLASVVISGPGAHEQLSREQLAAAVNAQVAAQLNWPMADDAFVISEKSATYACTAGLKRPAAQLATPGLFLCGDFYAGPTLAKNYPATLETAVRSGLLAANAVLKQ
jgi:hydroxysqualene dehydroxylase